MVLGSLCVQKPTCFVVFELQAKAELFTLVVNSPNFRTLDLGVKELCLVGAVDNLVILLGNSCEVFAVGNTRRLGNKEPVRNLFDHKAHWDSLLQQLDKLLWEHSILINHRAVIVLRVSAARMANCVSTIIASQDVFRVAGLVLAVTVTSSLACLLKNGRPKFLTVHSMLARTPGVAQIIACV